MQLDVCMAPQGGCQTEQGVFFNVVRQCLPQRSIVQFSDLNVTLNIAFILYDTMLKWCLILLNEIQFIPQLINNFTIRFI